MKEIRLLRADEEVWRSINGYDGEYLVSNIGRIKSLKSGKILKSSCLNGYRRIFLYKDSKRRCFFVHRLVAYAFLGDPERCDLQINHIDGNKANNCVDNLEWCTQSENLAHSFRIGLRDHNRTKLIEKNRKPVIQMDMNGNVVKEWYSMSEAARCLGLDVSNICNCCKGIICSTGGFKWAKA